MGRNIYLSLMIMIGIISIVTFKRFDIGQGNNWLYLMISGVLGFLFMFFSIKNQTNK